MVLMSTVVIRMNIRMVRYNKIAKEVGVICTFCTRIELSTLRGCQKLATSLGTL